VIRTISGFLPRCNTYVLEGFCDNFIKKVELELKKQTKKERKRREKII